MRTARMFFGCLLLVIIGLFGTLGAESFHVGQAVTSKATQSIGVPLHRESTPSYRKQVPDGSEAVLQKVGSKTPGTLTPSLHMSSAQEEALVWKNPEQCRQIVKAGGRMALPSQENIRVGTWNIRWFPHGSPPDRPHPSGEATDLDWLACTLVWMQFDVLAVQESLHNSEAKKGWDTIVQTLEQHTGDSWKWSPQPCGAPDAHHIGILWNVSRVALSHVQSLWRFNVKAKSSENPCAGGLRPGHYALIQSRNNHGVDFHLIALHLKSGPTVFALEDRQRALNRIDLTVAPLLSQDQDVVILGDFNTMGAGDNQSRKSEVKYVRRMVAHEKPGFEDLPPVPQCSHYFRGRSGWLDHVLVSMGMTEVKTRSSRVTGYCAVAECRRIKGDYPLAYRRLSDHCPVVIEIQNQDID